MIRLLKEYNELERSLSNLEICVAKEIARSYVSQGYDPYANEEIIKSELIRKGKSNDFITYVFQKMNDYKGMKFSYRIERYGSWDNGYILHSYKKGTLDKAEQDAKQASIKDPNDLYYVVIDDIMNPTTGWVWYNGQRYGDEDPQLNTIRRNINNNKGLRNECFSESLLVEDGDDVISFWATTVFDTRNTAVAYGAKIKCSDGWSFPGNISRIQQKLGERRFYYFSKGKNRSFRTYSQLVKFLKDTDSYIEVPPEEDIISAGYDERYFTN